MRGFLGFARKEMLEIVRTWRIWVLPGMLLFFALSGPLMAKFTPEILRAVGGSEMAALVKAMPKPSYLDAYGQWIKNLSQIGLFAIIIIYAGLISAERKSGTAILVLTKPLSRASYVVAKATVHCAFLAVTVGVTTVATWSVTRLVFGRSPGTPLWSAVVGWLALAIFFLGVMTLLSALLESQAGAAGLGLAVFAALSVAGMWEPLRDFSPAGLVQTPAILAAGKESAILILSPVITSCGLAILLVIVAAEVFRTKEL
jgi:ABC-2 type transport system permease protein